MRKVGAARRAARYRATRRVAPTIGFARLACRGERPSPDMGVRRTPLQSKPSFRRLFERSSGLQCSQSQTGSPLAFSEAQPQHLAWEEKDSPTYGEFSVSVKAWKAVVDEIKPNKIKGKNQIRLTNSSGRRLLHKHHPLPWILWFF